MTSILQVGPIAISLFVSELELFERKSPFFVLKIFTRPSVVLCLLLQPLRALRAGLSALSVIIEHLGIVSGEQTRSLRSLSLISQAKMDGHSALYLESMPSKLSVFFPCIFFNVKTSEFDFNKPLHPVNH